MKGLATHDYVCTMLIRVHVRVCVYIHDMFVFTFVFALLSCMFRGCSIMYTAHASNVRFTQALKCKTLGGVIEKTNIWRGITVKDAKALYCDYRRRCLPISNIPDNHYLLYLMVYRRLCLLTGTKFSIFAFLECTKFSDFVEQGRQTYMRAYLLVKLHSSEKLKFAKMSTCHARFGPP